MGHDSWNARDQVFVLDGAGDVVPDPSTDAAVSAGASYVADAVDLFHEHFDVRDLASDAGILAGATYAADAATAGASYVVDELEGPDDRNLSSIYDVLIQEHGSTQAAVTLGASYVGDRVDAAGVTLDAFKTAFDNTDFATASQQTDGSQRTGVLGADGSTVASNANPHPVSDAGGSLTVDGVPEFDVIYPIDEDAHDLAAAQFSATSNITDDFLLDYVLLKFSTAESRDITVTDADGGIVRKVEGNTNLSYVLTVNRVFKGSDNFTLTVTQTSGACLMDVKAVVPKGAISPPLGGNASTAAVDIDNVAITGFEELRTVETTPVISLKSIYGLSTLRDATVTAGSATITSTDAEYRLQTTASGGDSTTFSSAERGRYQAGTISEAGIGIRRPTAPTGNQDAVWGYMDEDNGFFFGEDATGIYVARRRGGTEEGKVYQSSWNTDKLNGAGASGLTLDLADGHIFRILFTWYGYGEILWQVVLGSPQRVVTVHREVVDGSTSVPNPNLPVRAEVDNAGTATAFDLYVAGRQFSIIGGFNPNRRITAAMVEGVTVSTALIPVLSFRRKAEFPTGVNNGASVKFQQLEIITDNDALWELRQGSTLVGASWGAPSRVSAAEAALEADTSATSASDEGEFLNTGFASGGARNSNEFTEEDFRFDLIETEPVTLYMRKLGAQDATVHATVKMREEW